jgi:hypothetical protein
MLDGDERDEGNLRGFIVCVTQVVHLWNTERGVVTNTLHRRSAFKGLLATYPDAISVSR